MSRMTDMSDDAREARAAVDPALLERLRRGFALRLDRQGGFWIADEAVTHPRVIAALRGGLDVSEGGEAQVHLGEQWCYLAVDDCPLRARSVAIDAGGGAAWLRLDDGRDVPLDPATLWEEPGLGLRASAPAQRSGRPLAVRFTNRAQMELAERIDLEATPPRLVLGGRAWPIGDQPPGR